MRLLFPIVLLICVSSLLGCRKIEEVAVPAAEENLLAFKTIPDPYISDESLDIFLKNPWYTYDEANHIIWPIFQIYALRTKGRYYKFQVIDYYTDQSLPGHYTLRIKPEGDPSFEWDFEAQGCGNVYTNLNYKECVKDPRQNVYTYLNVANRRSWKMSSVEAQRRKDWDIAFNGTEVKINSGDSGAGNARIAPLYLYGSFFNNGAADFQRIAEVSFSDKGLRFFEIPFDLKNAQYALPRGIDRIVYEPDWFQATRSGEHQAISENWWLLRGGEGDTYTKFSVSDIQESVEDEETNTQIVLKFYYQGKEDREFGAEQSWELPSFSTATRLFKWCLDFDTKSVGDCSSMGKSWDLRLSVFNSRGRRRWRINVNSGAVGPLSYEDMLSRETGRIQ